ncbi:hypothetical protein B0H14DRAFT_3427404 [Mycena olivaceomarginata]|nr:hypothetical protein B0H14DRAFT_3427404 [Mycena olivaceomarginata]
MEALIIQTMWSYELRSFLKLNDTKGEMMKTNIMLDMLIRDAITRGVLTALSSAVNMVLSLALLNTF